MVKQGLVRERVETLSSRKEDLPPIPPHQLHPWTHKGGGGGGKGGGGGGGGVSASTETAPSTSTPSKRVGGVGGGGKGGGGKRVGAAEAALDESNQKIAHFERSIRFLKNQQTEVLQVNIIISTRMHFPSLSLRPDVIAFSISLATPGCNCISHLSR